MDRTNDDSLVLSLLYVVPPMIGVGFLLMLLMLRFGVDSLVLPLAGVVAGTAARVVVVRVSSYRAGHARRQAERDTRAPLSWPPRVPAQWSMQSLRAAVAALMLPVGATKQRARHGAQAILTRMPEAAAVAQKLQAMLRTHLTMPAGPVGRDGAAAIDAAGGWEVGTPRQPGAAAPHEPASQPDRMV